MGKKQIILTKEDESRRDKVVFSEKEIIIEALRTSMIFVAIAREIFFHFRDKPNTSPYIQKALGLQLAQQYSMFIQQIGSWLISIRQWVELKKSNESKSLLDIVFNQRTINPSLLDEMREEYTNNKILFIESFLLSKNKKYYHDMEDSFDKLFVLFQSGEKSDYLLNKFHHLFNKTKHGCIVLLSQKHDKLIVPEKLETDQNGNDLVLPLFLPNKIREIEICNWLIESAALYYRRILINYYLDRFGEVNIPNFISDDIKQNPAIEKQLIGWMPRPI